MVALSRPAARAPYAAAEACTRAPGSALYWLEGFRVTSALAEPLSPVSVSDWDPASGLDSAGRRLAGTVSVC